MKCGRTRATLVAVIAFLAAPAVRASDSTPEVDHHFKVPREELLAKIKTVGLMKVEVPIDVPDAPKIAQRIETEVSERLAAIGLTVVPSLAYTGIRNRAEAALGGLFDPLTGAPNQDRIRAFQDFVRNEYELKHPVDAYLNVAVVVRQAAASRGQINWDGLVGETATGKTGFRGFTEGGNFSGTVPVLSLYVRLSGLDGKVLYASMGGLQPLAYLGTAKSGSGVEARRIDPKFVMSDPARDERAFEIALDPWIRGGAVATAARAANPVAIPESAAAPLPTRTALLAAHARVVIAPIDLPPLERQQDVAARYDDTLTSRLSKLGFTVAGSADYAKLLLEERDRLGGYYDIFTGKLDPAKLAAARSRVLETLRKNYGVTAVVTTGIEPRRAPFRYGTADWDGASESVSYSKSMLASAFGGSGDYVGVLNALSLVVRIVDAEDNSLFSGVGGIQLTEKLTDGRTVAIPPGELFADPAKNARAVEIALRGLAPPSSPSR